MGRGKLNMKLISNERSRMVTYQKRKKGLTKKVEEFKTLCDVDACVIVYGPKFNNPKFNNRPVDIETWPTDQVEMKRIIDRYRCHNNERKKSEDLSIFFQTRKKKIDDEIGKLNKACLEAKFPKWDNRLNSLEYQQLCLLNSVLQTKLEVAMSRVSNIKGDHYLMFDDYYYSKSLEINDNNKFEYSMGNTFANALHYQKNMELQSGMNINPFDDIPFNVNPQNSPMLMMMMMMMMKGKSYGGGDSVQFGSPDQKVENDNNVMVLNNNNNGRVHPYFGQVGLMPNVNDICSQLQNKQIPQFSDFCGRNVFEMTNKKREV